MLDFAFIYKLNHRCNACDIYFLDFSVEIITQGTIEVLPTVFVTVYLIWKNKGICCMMSLVFSCFPCLHFSMSFISLPNFPVQISVDYMVFSSNKDFDDPVVFLTCSQHVYQPLKFLPKLKFLAWLFSCTFPMV